MPGFQGAAQLGNPHRKARIFAGALANRGLIVMREIQSRQSLVAGVARVRRLHP